MQLSSISRSRHCQRNKNLSAMGNRAPQNTKEVHFYSTIYEDGTDLPTRTDLRKWREHKNGGKKISMSLAIALYSYRADNDEELSFSKGDCMILLEEPDGDWYYVFHEKTKKKGFVPRNYVEIYFGQPALLPGWYDIDRREAIMKLILPGLENGTYILRNSSYPGDFALSVRYKGCDVDFVDIYHYKIYSLSDDGPFYISKKIVFDSLQDLITYYQRNSGLCCQLTQPYNEQHAPSVQLRDFELNRQLIELKHLLGKGEYGEVYQGVWKNRFEVAVKVRRTNTNRTDFIDEAKRMYKLNHPRIVKLLGVCTEPLEEPVYIITELMRKGSLKAFLQSTEGHALQQKDLLLILAQVAEGMEYLEKENMIHRDLRAANILVDENHSVKVADFGLSKLINSQTDQNNDSNPIKLPVKWTAPECAGPDMNFSIKSDVWSFGVLMYEVITYGETPYPGIPQSQVFQRVREGYRMEKPISPNYSCPDSIYEKMRLCWEKEPQDRPTFTCLLDYFLNWVWYEEQQYME